MSSLERFWKGAVTWEDLLADDYNILDKCHADETHFRSEIMDCTNGVRTFYSSTYWNATRNNICCRISEPLPQVTLLDGLPAVPGLMGSLPGIGGCLPAKMPLVSQTSPNFFQNFLRFIPGAQDYLVSLVETPNINTTALMGRYQWVSSNLHLQISHYHRLTDRCGIKTTEESF